MCLPLTLVTFALSLTLSGCGVLYSYINNQDKLDERLSVPMTREEVLEQLGKPDTVLRDDGQKLVWEYRLYSRHHWLRELLFCPVTAWFFGGCIFYPFVGSANPNYPHPHYVILIDDQLCMWGPPRVIETRKVCKTLIVAKLPTQSGKGSGEAGIGAIAVSIMAVHMPPLFTNKVHRLAILPLSDGSGYTFRTSLDLTLNFLRNRHPDLVLVERDLRPVLDEVLLQYSGRVNDESTVRVGRLAGADSLLVYSIEALPPSIVSSMASHGGTFSGIVELKLLDVERGTVLFRQQAMATAGVPPPRQGLVWPDEAVRQAHRVAVSEASSYALAALVTAFGDNPLGFVPDTTVSDAAKVFGFLVGGPAHLAGLKKGDRILAVNGQQITLWTSLTPLPLPATLTVERGGERREIGVGRP